MSEFSNLVTNFITSVTKIPSELYNELKPNTPAQIKQSDAAWTRFWDLPLAEKEKLIFATPEETVMIKAAETAQLAEQRKGNYIGLAALGVGVLGLFIILGHK